MKFERVRGFRDNYPEDMMPRKRIFSVAENSAESLGFKKVDFPSLEYMDLYRLKSGEELVGQTFSFTDKKGRDVTMIPEATPSVVRMITSRKDLVKPIRWYSFPKIFRYEEPQSGRFREHYQFNADIFGVDSPEADAEVIGLAGTILDELGLDNRYEIRLNSRPLLESVLAFLECKDIPLAFQVVDRFRKVSREEFLSQISGTGIGDSQAESLYALISGTIHPSKLQETIEAFGKFESAENIHRITYVAELVSSMILSPVRIDLSIVRGLSYYTGIVFEAYDVKGKHRAILGGGRYDNLATLMAGQDIPAIGFGMGDAVIEILLREEGKWSYTLGKPQFYVCCVTPESRKYVFSVSKIIRESGGITLDDLSGKGLSAQLRSAVAEKCEYAAIIGEREEKTETVTFRNLESGTQIEINVSEIGDFLKDMNELK